VSRTPCHRCGGTNAVIIRNGPHAEVRCATDNAHLYFAPKVEIGEVNAPVTIKPIETRYAGCRFRSRLEARWAVFFDALDIEWQYEPQGFEIGLSDEVHTRRYLPDFYLPRFDTWVEVKPISLLDLDFVAACVIPHGGGLPNGRLLLLHEIPKESVTYTTTWARLRWHKGDIFCDDVEFEFQGLLKRMSWVVGNDSSWTVCTDLLSFPMSGDWIPYDLQEQYGFGDLCVMDVSDAYEAARSARFEFGESGAAA
jgi:hypothetical protein